MLCLISNAIVTIVVVYSVVYFASLIFLRPKKIKGFQPQGRVVVITGCDTGFGNLSAFHLSALGYTVVALCYTENGVESLRSSGKIAHVLQCDVTKEEDIERVANYTKKMIEESDEKGKPLKFWSLINNAGIAPSGCVDWVSMKSVRAVMEVNYFGLVFCCKAFLPLLKTTKHSRVLNISSAAGFSSFPGGSSYCASKHAVEGFGKCFRQECVGWDIHVCNVNPGFTKTPLLANSEVAAYKEFENAPKEITNQYPITNLSESLSVMHSIAGDPMVVVHSIASILEQDRPVLVNPPDWQSSVIRWMFHIIPHGLMCFIQQFSLKRKVGFGPYPEIRKKIQVK